MLSSESRGFWERGWCAEWPPKGLPWLLRESWTQPLCLPHPPGSPGLAGTLQGCHVKAPDAQGCRHGEEHCQPAAGHDQRHEQAEVVDSWDLAMKGGGDGRGSGLEPKEPRDSAALGPDHPQTEAGCEGRGCGNEGTGLGGCQRAGLEPGVWQRGRVQPLVDTAALCPEQCPA